MNQDIKVAFIGLDTSHTVEFARRMVAPDCPPDQKVPGLVPLACLRFSTRFQSEDGLNQRQKTLEGWGIKVTTSLEEAVAGCDALMLEINDPAYHLEYFTRCADLGKMIFLDKPFAASLAHAEKIHALIKTRQLKVFSSSSLRYVPAFTAACEEMPKPVFVHAFGPLGKAPADSSIIWYGVHTFEMLQRAMGRGALSVFVKPDGAGLTAIVQYSGNRRGVVELLEGAYVYGGCLHDKEKAIPFVASTERALSDLLSLIANFFRTARTPLELADTLEVIALLEATQRALESGKEEAVQDLK